MNELTMTIVSAAPRIQMTLTPLTHPAIVIGASSTDAFYEFEQAVASAEWLITHSLGKFPSVSVVDSAGSLVMGEVQYISVNELVVRFSAPFSGKAYLN